jgi:hypothetical protein
VDHNDRPVDDGWLVQDKRPPGLCVNLLRPTDKTMNERLVGTFDEARRMLGANLALWGEFFGVLSGSYSPQIFAGRTR